jgi:FKBP-type peptidyl-prolyl cis-trans isomerase SlyD
MGFPLGYIQGISEVLSSEVTAELVGQEQGDVIELPINCDEIYGPRDESLVFTDHIDNVPEEYRKIGMTVTMENEAGEPKDFIVTRVDENSVTVDGNNPMCGREVIFILQVIFISESSHLDNNESIVSVFPNCCRFFYPLGPMNFKNSEMAEQSRRDLLIWRRLL